MSEIKMSKVEFPILGLLISADGKLITAKDLFRNQHILIVKEIRNDIAQKGCE